MIPPVLSETRQDSSRQKVPITKVVAINKKYNSAVSWLVAKVYRRK